MSGKGTKILLAAALAAAISARPGPAMGQSAVQLTPVMVDRAGGFVYFLVMNKGLHTIENLFGWVYGHGAPEAPGAYLVNNPHAQGQKVSLGEHVPGSAAMYRFAVAEAGAFFPRYTLLVSDKSIFHKRRTGP
ncbi:MAG: hypothetical protein ACNS63_07240 [Candidatus Nitrospinota bacterium M3_3B_026]